MLQLPCQELILHNLELCLILHYLLASIQSISIQTSSSIYFAALECCCWDLVAFTTIVSVLVVRNFKEVWCQCRTARNTVNWHFLALWMAAMVNFRMICVGQSGIGFLRGLMALKPYKFCRRSGAGPSSLHSLPHESYCACRIIR